MNGANCNEWASYEPEGASPTASLCHGGWFEGNHYDSCPKKLACKVATERLTMTTARRLPVLNPATGPRPLQPTRIEVPSLRPTQDLSRVPTALQQRASQYGQRADTGYPQPIIPPEEYPKAMRTPYASITPVYQGGVSPTFLPRDNEEVFGRLGKNMLQGVLASSGWHIYDYSRSVDLFS